MRKFDIPVTPAFLRHELERLDLGRTEITNAGLEHLDSLPKLQVLGLRGTLVSAPGIAKLKERLPSIVKVWH